MANKSKRILIFTTAYRPFVGGSEIAIEEVVQRLPDTFFDIVTPKLEGGLADMECSANYCIFRVGSGWIGDKFFFPLLGFLRARKLAEKNHYDFYHVFQASYAAGAAWLVKLFDRKTPLILTLQEGKALDKQNWFVRFFRMILVKRANKISAISGYLRKYAAKIKKGIPIRLIPNGVDIENFSRDFSYGELSELQDRHGIKPGEKIIISVSRLVPKNGLSDLIAATAILARKLQGQSIKLLLVGEGKQKEELILLSEALGIKDKVIFAGQVSHRDLPKYLKISNVFVRPSLSEGMGNSFLEAMAAGVPIIGTPVGGIPDFLKNRESGLFCEVENPEDLAEAINTIFSDDDLKDRLIHNARTLVVENYSWDKIAKDYEELVYQ